MAGTVPSSTPVLLNNVDHHDVRILTDRGTAWGDEVNEITVFPTEFDALSREYTILFRRSDSGAFRATVLLGLDRGENLFVEGTEWKARFIPALMQRGPFSIGLPAPGEPGGPMIHIDLADPRVSRTGGEPVFLDHGGNAPYLDHVGGVLRTVFAGNQILPDMIAAFVAADLLDEATLDVDVGDGRRYSIPEVFVVSAERFARLDGAALAALHAGDFLRCAVWAITSLGNISALIERKRTRDGAR
ncbi:SapC family protein [Sphingomonas sp. TREG-RG-20F-R18-01]|uniref:SapC family protein n=1 Tax=Sphingomonas sp. TREG-RG-20F-R18-01 TaxID=2914982 RepID=UPI001F56C15E|nr:SapC family protein [Sphingomonas sp. TREG-RG-20F-R18-01]